MSVQRLVRFVSREDGQTYYGSADADLKTADVLAPGNPFSVSAKPTGTRKEIAKLLSPLAIDDCRGVICIGLNYKDHAEEAKMAIPDIPVVFHKSITALAGPYDDLLVPRVSWEKGTLDCEAELVIVVGKKASRVPKEAAMDYIFGFTVGNDFSNRVWQLEKALSGSQWAYSKSFDCSAPIGPAIVSDEALGGVGNLRIQGKLNGSTMQDGNTNNLIFSVAEIVSFLSQGMTLLPGTLIFTGTPAGVGMGRTPQVFVKENDIVEVEISGIGGIRNKVMYEN